jgi:hypothetical protein
LARDIRATENENGASEKYHEFHKGIFEGKNTGKRILEGNGEEKNQEKDILRSGELS